MIIRLSSFANESLCHCKQLQREIHTVCGVTLPSMCLMQILLWFSPKSISNCILIKRL